MHRFDRLLRCLVSMKAGWSVEVGAGSVTSKREILAGGVQPSSGVAVGGVHVLLVRLRLGKDRLPFGDDGGEYVKPGCGSLFEL